MIDTTPNRFVPRSSAAEKKLRVDYVKALIDQDITSPQEIRLKVSERFDHDFSEMTIFRYIKDAKKEIALENPGEVSFTISLHINRYEQMYYDCKKNGDNRGAIIAMQAKEKLLGLHNPEVQINIQNNTLNHSGPKLDLSKLPEEQIKMLMSAIIPGSTTPMLNPDSNETDDNFFEDVTDFE
jgi:hypothetical protein